MVKGARGVDTKTRSNALYLSTAAQFNVEVAMKVKEYGYGTPLQSAKSILYIIDTFNLWDIEIFNFGDEKIKTHKACLKFMEEN